MYKRRTQHAHFCLIWHYMKQFMAVYVFAACAGATKQPLRVVKRSMQHGGA